MKYENSLTHSLTHSILLSFNCQDFFGEKRLIKYDFENITNKNFLETFENKLTAKEKIRTSTKEKIAALQRKLGVVDDGKAGGKTIKAAINKYWYKEINENNNNPSEKLVKKIKPYYLWGKIAYEVEKYLNQKNLNSLNDKDVNYSYIIKKYLKPLENDFSKDYYKTLEDKLKKIIENAKSVKSTLEILSGESNPKETFTLNANGLRILEKHFKLTKGLLKGPITIKRHKLSIEVIANNKDFNLLYGEKNSHTKASGFHINENYDQYPDLNNILIFKLLKSENSDKSIIDHEYQHLITHSIDDIKEPIEEAKNEIISYLKDKTKIPDIIDFLTTDELYNFTTPKDRKKHNARVRILTHIASQVIKNLGEKAYTILAATPSNDWEKLLLY